MDILKRLPVKYQKEFLSIEPKHAEDIPKPLDEKGVCFAIPVTHSDVPP